MGETDKDDLISIIEEDDPEAIIPTTLPMMPVRDVVIFTDMLLRRNGPSFTTIDGQPFDFRQAIPCCGEFEDDASGWPVAAAPAWSEYTAAHGANVLHMGDVFFYGLYPFIDLDGGGTVQGLITAVELGLSLSGDATRVIPGHGPLTDKAGLQGYHDMLVAIRDSVQTMIDDGLSLQQVVDAKPTAQWDEELGGAFIKPDQLVAASINDVVAVGILNQIFARILSCQRRIFTRVQYPLLQLGYP